MYQPVEFSDNDPRRAWDHIVRNPFGILVAGAASSMTATHLPLLLDNESDPTALLSHCAIRNTALVQSLDGSEVMAIFPGPHTYVSPRLYEIEKPAPTWNYTAVHVYGTARRVEAKELQSILKRTVAQFEGQSPQAWTLDSMPLDALRSLARGIVGFRIDIDRVEAGYKLSQNKVAADVAAIAHTLGDSTDADDRAVAELMRRGGLQSRTGPSSTDPNTWLGPMT